MSRKGDGISSPKGLEGKTYSTWDSPIEQAMIKHVMEKDGEKYLRIIPTGQFVKAQLEKQKRSNITSDHTSKTARYNSENVLSGLLVCKEFGKIFRRITRKDGEIVWRCADRVENGKQAVCQNLHTVSDAEVKKAICDFLETDQFDDVEVKRNIYRIEIEKGEIHCISQTEQLFGMYM